MKNNKMLKKSLSILLLLTITALPTIVWASSYSSSLSFDTTLKGQVRSFDGSDITMDIDAYTVGYNRAASSYFSATLTRKNRFTTSTIGSASYLRDGSTSNTWSNVGSGNYYFYFSKGNDGVYVVSDDVEIYN